MPGVQIPDDHLRTPSTPRVRPRPKIEDLVDRSKHPARRRIATTGEDADADRLHWTSLVAIVLLAAFWAFLTISGVIAAVIGPRASLGTLGAAMASLVAHYRIEAE